MVAFIFRFSFAFLAFYFFGLYGSCVSRTRQTCVSRQFFEVMKPLLPLTVLQLTDVQSALSSASVALRLQDRQLQGPRKRDLPY